MAQDADVERQKLLKKIQTGQASIDAYVRVTQRRRDLVANTSIISSAIAATLVAGPTVGGVTFAETVQRGLGFEQSSSVWRVLCLASLIVNLVAATSANLNKSNEPAERINIAQAYHAVLEELHTKVERDNLPVSAAESEYRKIVSNILFVPMDMADDGTSEDRQSAPPPYRYHTAELALPGMTIIFGCIIVLMTVIGLLLGQGKATADPRLVLSSSQVKVGDSYSITAEGFSGENVQFSWIGPTNDTMGPFRTDTGGSTRLAGTLQTHPGTYLVTARGLTSGRIAWTPLVVQPGN